MNETAYTPQGLPRFLYGVLHTQNFDIPGLSWSDKSRSTFNIAMTSVQQQQTDYCILVAHSYYYYFHNNKPASPTTKEIMDFFARHLTEALADGYLTCNISFTNDTDNLSQYQFTSKMFGSMSPTIWRFINFTVKEFRASYIIPTSLQVVSLFYLIPAIPDVTVWTRQELQTMAATGTLETVPPTTKTTTVNNQSSFPPEN